MPLIKNRILGALPRDERSRIVSRLEPVRLAKGKILYESGDYIWHTYFPNSGLGSLLLTTEDGAVIEVGVIGNEGMIGVPAILRTRVMPYTVMMQISGEGMKINGDALIDEFNRGGKLQDLLLRYMHTVLTQISQSAVCNRFHTIRQRLCRWLLTSRDRVQSSELPLTQEFLSLMLGAPPTAVTMTAGALKKSGMIRYRRGQITILDQKGLESNACECYRVIKDEYEQFLAA